MTTTTVGYGDVASFFFEQEQESDLARLHRKLDELHEKVDALSRRSGLNDGDRRDA